MGISIRFFLSLGSGLAFLIIGGCHSKPLPDNVEPGVVNMTEVAHVSSVVNVTEFPKKFYVVPDEMVKQSRYVKEVITYTENGLKYIGYTKAANEKEAELIVKIGFHETGNRRESRYFVMTATKNDTICWTVNTSCSSRAGDLRPYLPGLVAAAIPYVGKTTTAAINLNKHQNYLKAVMDCR